MADGIHVDLNELSRELKDLDKQVATALRKQIRSAVSAAGADVLGGVRSRASWSKRIPAATKLTTSFSARRSGITIRTSASKAPHARPLEQGNRNGYSAAEINRRIGAGHARSARQAQRQIRHEGGASRVNRHPVFNHKDARGKQVYADQPTRPYFFPTVAAAARGIDASFQEAIDRAVREAGFH